MPNPSNKTKAAAMTLCAAIALLELGGNAKALDTKENLERWTEKLEFDGVLPDRPKLVGDRLVWRDHSLSELCAELRGTFRKLGGRPEYMCRIPHLARETASDEAAGE